MQNRVTKYFQINVVTLFFFYGISSTDFVTLLPLKQNLKHTCMTMLFINKNALYSSSVRLVTYPLHFRRSLRRALQK